MFKKGQAYIVYLLLFFVSLNIAYSALYINFRQAETLNNLFLQVKCSRLAESGINYFEKTSPALPQNPQLHNPTIEQIKGLNGLVYFFKEGSFKLAKSGQKLFSVGLYRGKSVIYQKEGTIWHYFTD